MTATVCLKDFVNNCTWTVLFASNLPQAPLNACFIFVNFGSFNAFSTVST